MDPITIGLLGCVALLILLIIGMPIAFATALIGFLGIFVIKSWSVAAGTVGYLVYPLAAHYTLSVIPMFILMGYFAFYAGLTSDIFSVGRKWVGHLPGGMAIATVFGCAAFAASSGSSTASAAVMGKVAIPEMKKYHYDNKLSAGVVAASGTLASLIPPSAILVVFGVIVEESIGKLLIAGFLPGMLSAFIYALMLYVWARIKPEMAPVTSEFHLKEALASLKYVWGIGLLFILVIGGLYMGVFTPTEAGAAGAFGAFAIALFSLRLSWSNLFESLLETARATVMIFMIIIGVLIFMRFLALSGVSRAFIEAVQALPVPRWIILSGFLAFYVILGMFMDAIGMLTLTLPLMFPIIVGLGYHPIWFGIIAVKMCEVCLISPPIGLNVYMVRGVAPDIPLEDMFKGVIPFLAMDILTLIILIIFPQIATFLPSKMIG
jgi:tripartite ATP-independent transporter DctM subunit